MQVKYYTIFRNLHADPMVQKSYGGEFDGADRYRKRIAFSFEATGLDVRSSRVDEITAGPSRRGKEVEEKLPPRSLANFFPVFTYMSMVACVVMYVLSMVEEGDFVSTVINPMCGASPATLTMMGARDAVRTNDDSEYWRLLTANFVPTGLLPLLFSLLFQFWIMAPLERLYGPWAVIMLFVLAGTFGQLLSAVFLPGVLSTGPTAACMGLVGLDVVNRIEWNLYRNMRAHEARVCLFWVACFLVLGAFPGLDNWANFGGLLIGFPLAVPVTTIGIKRGVRLLLICLSVAVVVWAFAWTVIVLVIVVDPLLPCDWCLKATTIDAYNWRRFGSYEQETFYDEVMRSLIPRD